MAFCLMPSALDKFKKGLLDGTIDPEKLSGMSSEERHAFFSKIVGEDAAQGVNAGFESKLLLKNQKQGYLTWAKRVAGVSPEARRDLLSRIQRLDHVLDPGEEKAFLKDLAATKLGFGVTREQSQTIANLAKKISEAEAKPLSTIEESIGKKKGIFSRKTTFTPTKNDMDLAYARYDLQKYISDAKNEAARLHRSDFKTVGGVVQSTGRLPGAVANISKSIGASLDDSFALRQGNKAFFTHPTYWQKEFRQSFKNLAAGAKNADEAQREFKARLMADPAYEQAVKDGLRLSKPDDVFPTTAPGKIWVAGRAFNASEIAYDAYAENLRLGLYKNELRIAKGKGKEMDTTFRKNIAKMINSLTGSGDLGKGERIAGSLNVAFYSLRFLKSNVDTLISHPLGFGVGGFGDKLAGREGAKVVSYAQRRAAQNLVHIIVGTAAILEAANKLKPGSVDFDPRSTDFGKIKVGDTRFDVSGGAGSVLTLAARIATRSTKSSSGNITKLNSGQHQSKNVGQVLLEFAEGKTSPAGSVVVDNLLRGTDFEGNVPTVKGEVANTGTPLNIQNYEELRSHKNAANILGGVIADTFGISTNTYAPTDNNKNRLNKAPKEVTDTLENAGYVIAPYNQNERGKELSKSQFAEYKKRTQQNFVQAVQKARTDPTFQNYTPKQKKASLTSTMTEAKKKALNDMHIPKAPKTPHVKSY